MVKRTLTTASDGCARYVGRVGVLAVALGVGFAVSTAPGVAWAEPVSDTAVADVAASDEPPPTSVDAPPTSSISDNQSSVADEPESTVATSSPTELTLTSEVAPEVIVRSSGGALTSGDDEVAPAEETPNPVSTPGESAALIVPATPGPTPVPPVDPVVVSTDAAHGAAATSEAPKTTGVPDVETAPTVLLDSTTLLLPSTPAGDQGESSSAPLSRMLSTQSFNSLAPEEPAAELSPLEALVMAPASLLEAGLGFASGLLQALFVPSPGAPADSPLVWAVLALVRRQFFNETPEVNAALGAPDAQGRIKITLDAADSDGDVLRYTATNGAKGVVTLNADGRSFTYTPNVGATGTDVITVTATDDADGHVHGLWGLLRADGAHVAVRQVSVPLAAIDRPPVVDSANPVTVNGVSGPYGAVTGRVNVTDPENRPLTYALSSVPPATAGIVTVDSATGAWTYTPTPVARVRAYGTEAADVASFAITASDCVNTTAPIAVSAPIDAVATAPYPPIDGLATGPVRFGADGTGYQFIAIYRPETGAYESATAVYKPNATSPVLVAPIPGVILQQQFGADGNIYLTTAVPSASFALESWGVTIVRPDGTFSSVPIPSTLTGDIVLDQVGYAYQASYVRDAAADTYETTFTKIDTATGESSHITVPGYSFGGPRVAPNGVAYYITETRPFNNFGELDNETLVSVVSGTGEVTTIRSAGNPADSAFGRDGVLYLKTRDPADFSRYLLTVVDPSGAVRNRVDLADSAVGVLVAGADGTVYQSIDSGSGLRVVLFDRDGASTEVPLGGSRVFQVTIGPGNGVHIGPDGDVYQIVTGHGEGTEVYRINPNGTADLVHSFAALALRYDATEGYLSLDDGTVIFDPLSDAPTPVAVGAPIASVSPGSNGYVHVRTVNPVGSPIDVFRVVSVNRDTFATAVITGTVVFEGSSEVSNNSIRPDGAVYQLRNVAGGPSGDLPAEVLVFTPSGAAGPIVLAGVTGHLVFGQDGTAYHATRLINADLSENYDITVISPEGTRLATIPFGDSSIQTAVLGPDGRVYLTLDAPDGSGSTVVAVDSTGTSQVIATFPGYARGAVTFDPDGTGYVTTIGEGGAVRTVTTVVYTPAV